MCAHGRLARQQEEEKAAEIRERDRVAARREAHVLEMTR